MTDHSTPDAAQGCRWTFPDGSTCTLAVGQHKFVAGLAELHGASEVEPRDPDLCLPSCTNGCACDGGAEESAQARIRKSDVEPAPDLLALLRESFRPIPRPIDHPDRTDPQT